MLNIMGIVIFYGLVVNQFPVDGFQVSSNFLREGDVLRDALFEPEPMFSNPMLFGKDGRDVPNEGARM